MIYNHNEYLNFELPDNWCSEENEDSLTIYDSEKDEGAITMSFYNIMMPRESLVSKICDMAKKFIDSSEVKLHESLILNQKKDGSCVLSGTGDDSEGWFVKLWIVAKYPKIVVATYYNKTKNGEIDICDSIIDSMSFDL